MVMGGGSHRHQDHEVRGKRMQIEGLESPPVTQITSQVSDVPGGGNKKSHRWQLTTGGFSPADPTRGACAGT